LRHEQPGQTDNVSFSKQAVSAVGASVVSILVFQFAMLA